MTKNTAEEIRKKLSSGSQQDTKKSTPPIIQEVSYPVESKKLGRKKHRLEGVEYARVSASIPADLKNEMSIAILTTHKNFPTIDTFIAEAVRVFLSMKK
jgi:hypothetical protein